MSVRWALAAAVSLTVPLGGCLEVPAFRCEGHDVCVLNQVQGTCRFDTNTCVYPAPADVCPSMWRDANGNCVDGNATSDFTTTLPGNTSDLPDTTTSVDPTTSTGTTMSPVSAGSTSTGVATSGSSSTSDTGVTDPCDGVLDNITSLGVVGASTVFTDFPPGLSVDGDLSTSWFSTGPEGVDVPSIYNWTLSNEHCIARLFISGNGLHDQQEFQEGYGFGRVVFRILDANNEEVFEQERLLPGTPDPDIMVDVPGVVGKRVVLELYEHENEDCGGFSELQVLGD